MLILPHLPVSQKPVQLTNGKRLVHFIAGTDFFAGMVADATTNTRERVILLEKCQSFRVFSLVDEGDVPLDADMGRAGGLAGRGTAFTDAKGSGNCLGVLFENRLSIRQAFVVFVGQGYGAYLDAFTAACAFIKIDKPGLLVQGGGQISGFAFKIQKFGIGEQFDI